MASRDSYYLCGAPEAGRRRRGRGGDKFPPYSVILFCSFGVLLTATNDLFVGPMGFLPQQLISANCYMRSSDITCSLCARALKKAGDFEI